MQGGFSSGGGFMSTAVKYAPSKTESSRARARAGKTAPRREKTAPEARVIRRSVGGSSRSSTASRTKPPMSSRQRRVLVFGGLIAVLTVTSALLLAMQPAPLAPDAARSLMSLTSPAEVEALFDTQIPMRHGRWKYIYVHHSGATAGSASSLADASGPTLSVPDHFVVGNGEGAGDGEIQMGQRWNTQQAAGKARGLDRVDPDCISICVIGDLDRASPTPRQMEQLNRLVTSLQNKMQIGRDRVWMLDAPAQPAGSGRYFPRDVFKTGLLP
jgi:hypothetical protein